MKNDNKMTLILKYFPKMRIFDESNSMCCFCVSHLITELKRLLRGSDSMARGHALRTVYVRDSHGSRSRCQKSLKTNAANCLWNVITAETVTLQLHYWR